MLRSRDTPLSAFERPRHVGGIAKTDQVSHRRQQRLPELERETGSRILPPPRREAEKVLIDDCPRALAEIIQLLRLLPTRRERGDFAPRATESREELVVHLDDTPVFPVSFRIVRRRLHEVFLRTEENAKHIDVRDR
jgi:hypothetical protein